MKITTAGIILLCALMSRLFAAESTSAQPPIPIRFQLNAPGFVTLVIDDASGQRVRNLVSETPFAAGAQVTYWDGLDDLGRDPEAAKAAIYHVPGKTVAPGRYTVRGLFRPELKLRYEMTPYTHGVPPWKSKDRSSEWIANHSAPSAVLFVPESVAPKREGKNAPGGQIIVGSFVSEGGSGVSWLDLQGRKIHGQLWIGGVWTGATQLTRDEGSEAVPGVYAYSGSAWEGELRLYELLDEKTRVRGPADSRFGTGEDRSVLDVKWKFPKGKFSDHDKRLGLLGLAVRNGLLVASLPTVNQLLFVDGKEGKALGTVPLDSPRGLAFDKQGRLLALSATKLLRFTLSKEFTPQLPKADLILDTGARLEDPQQLALDGEGNIFVSDLGKAHQVKVFSSAGKFLRAIGVPGQPAVGPYNSRKMNNPNGVTIAGDGHLWVAENDKTPKRLSVWKTSGEFVRAFYGPAQYGGGGFLDSEDQSRFFYADEGGMELKLNWEAGASEPVSVYFRPELDPFGLKTAFNPACPPGMPIHHEGRTYLTDAHNNNPTGGWGAAAIWILEKGIARPVAALGRPEDWNVFFGSANSNAFLARIPGDKNLKSEKRMFVWSDANDDGQPQPEEVEITAHAVGSVNVMNDLSFVTGTGLHLKPQRFTRGGAPIFDSKNPVKLVAQTQNPASSGGGQTLVAGGGWSVFTTPPKPFSPYGIAGVRNGNPLWSYPSMWPGLHASHHSAVPDFPGELIGTTRLLGSPITIGGKGATAGALEIFTLNGNKGTVYLFTTDGLFVATLFQDSRTASWDFPKAERGMLVNTASLHEESFWPNIMQTRSGEVFLEGNGNLVRVEDIDKTRRLPDQQIEVTPQQLVAARDWFLQAEGTRQQTNTSALTIGLLAQAPVVDGQARDWPSNLFVRIDTRRLQIGDWGSKRVNTEAALAVSGDRLYACFKTAEPDLLENSGETWPLHFKTGGALDLMLATAANGNANRAAAAGDVRLLVTLVKKKPVATLYRPVAPGGGRESFPFTSPLRTVNFDRIDDVSRDLLFKSQFVKNEKDKTQSAIYEFSIPLATLGLKATAGTSVYGDLGVLRGDGSTTLQRSYWRNKSSALTSDLPSEAELTPRLWGRMEFKPVN